MVSAVFGNRMRTEIVLILLLITTIVSGRRTHHHTKDVHRFSIDTEEGRRELINYYNEDVEAVSKKKDSGSRLPANRSNGSGKV